MGMAGQPAPRLLLLIHGTFWPAQLLLRGREREQSACPLQPDGEDASTMWTTCRQTWWCLDYPGVSSTYFFFSSKGYFCRIFFCMLGFSFSFFFWHSTLFCSKNIQLSMSHHKIWTVQQLCVTLPENNKKPGHMFVSGPLKNFVSCSFQGNKLRWWKKGFKILTFSREDKSV